MMIRLGTESTVFILKEGKHWDQPLTRAGLWFRRPGWGGRGGGGGVGGGLLIAEI